MALQAALVGACTVIPFLLLLYIRINDRVLGSIPNRALNVSPARCKPKDVLMTASRLARAPITSEAQIPPRTGRRYIIIGGVCTRMFNKDGTYCSQAGFLGGWIVVQLIQRGEDPKRIRVLDIRQPTRHDLVTGPAKDVQFIKVDISDPKATRQAFAAPWADSDTNVKVTIIHTAANIRFYERHISLVPNSAKVNVNGTQNVIDASLSIGASTLIYTSSASVAIRSNRFFLWPWQKEPKHFVQAINDDDRLAPKYHCDFFSNYAYTKKLAEQKVRAADKSRSGCGNQLRTGCLRPGNGVFGPGGDMLCGAYLVRQNNPTWIGNIVSNFSYVENCALAHLCYEQRLIELEMGSSNPDIGGQAFNIADPGPPPTYGDVYTTLETLTDGETFFPTLSPTGMLLVAHLIEFYYLFRHFVISAFPLLAKIIPAINGDLVNLQPSLWNLVNVHLIFDDSRARLPPEKGGLGYKGAWTTLEALHKTVEEHKKGLIRSEERSKVAGISFGFGLVKAQRAVAKVGEKVEEEIGVDPVKVLGTKNG